jgi:hypothetical protein
VRRALKKKKQKAIHSCSLAAANQLSKPVNIKKHHGIEIIT